VILNKIAHIKFSKSDEINFIELSVTAMVPPGRRTRNASFTNPVIARAGHSWHCRFLRCRVTALVMNYIPCTYPLKSALECCAEESLAQLNYSLELFNWSNMSLVIKI